MSEKSEKRQRRREGVRGGGSECVREGGRGEIASGREREPERKGGRSERERKGAQCNETGVTLPKKHQKKNQVPKNGERRTLDAVVVEKLHIRPERKPVRERRQVVTEICDVVPDIDPLRELT